MCCKHVSITIAVLCMGPIILMTTRQRFFLVSGVILIFAFLGTLTFFSIQAHFAEGTYEAPSPTVYFSPIVKEPDVVEKVAFVYPPYLEVNGRNYTAGDVLDLLEAKGFRLMSFESWVRHLMNTAEGQISFSFNGDVYGAGEYEIRDVESEDCAVEFEHSGFTEGVLLCGNVEIETEDLHDLICSIEIFFEKDSRYELGKIKNCIVDLP